MKSDIGKLTSDWKDISEVVLYGAGTVSEICKDLFDKLDVKISYVIDKDIDKQKKGWFGHSVYGLEDIKNDFLKRKIVVMTAHSAFNEIANELDRLGLREFKDYCRIGHFITEWFWNNRSQNCLFHVDMTVSTVCSLNCKYCNMFIPYYDRHDVIPFETLKKNVDLLFARIDYVVYLGLIGGEPLLNNNLAAVIEYIFENYSEKVGKVTFTTNGKQIPDKKFVETIKKFDVLMEISDYSKIASYEDKYNELIDMLNKQGVSYSVRKNLTWCDFGFPTHPFRRSEEEQKEHLAACRPEWNGLNDGKFYYCNVSWSADKSGKFKLSANDYIVLEDIDPIDKEKCHEILELGRGTSSFCKICGGCGKDNMRYVIAGVQL